MAEVDNRLSVPSPYSEVAAAAATGSSDDQQLEYGRRESLISTSMVCSRRQSGEHISKDIKIQELSLKMKDFMTIFHSVSKVCHIL